MLRVLNGQNPKPERQRQKAAPTRLSPARVEPEEFKATSFVKVRAGAPSRFRSSSRVFATAKTANDAPKARKLRRF